MDNLTYPDLHNQNTSQQIRNFQGLNEQDAADTFSHNFRGPGQYTGPRSTMTTARPLPAPPNDPYAAMQQYSYSPYATPYPSQGGARAPSFAPLTPPVAAGDQPTYPPRSAIPLTPPNTYDHGNSAHNHMLINHPLDTGLSSHNALATPTYHDGYPSVIRFSLNEHGLPALIGEEDRQPFSVDGVSLPTSRPSSFDSSGSMEYLQPVDHQHMPPHLEHGGGIATTQHAPVTFSPMEPQFPLGVASTRSYEQPYGPYTAAAGHPLAAPAEGRPPNAATNDGQHASQMPLYNHFDPRGQHSAVAARPSALNQYGIPIPSNDQASTSTPRDAASRAMGLEPSNYLQHDNQQHPSRGGRGHHDPLTQLPRSLEPGVPRQLVVRNKSIATTGNRYTPYRGPAPRGFPSVSNVEFESVGQHVQPNNNHKPRTQSQHTPVPTGIFSGNVLPPAFTPSQGAIYGPPTPSGPDAGTSYGGGRAAGMSATSGDAEQLSTLPSNMQVRSAIGGRTQYQSMVGPSPRQGEWESGFLRMASAPRPSHDGVASYMDDAAAYSPADGTSDVPGTLLAPPASAGVSPTPSTSHPLIDVQPDPKRPEHADPLRPWLVPRGKLPKAQRIRTFIAERAAAAGDHSWPRQCPHADCRERAEWLAGSRAQEPSYPSENALVRHIERCGDEKCEFCLEDGAYFGRPALAQLHRAGIDRTACKVIAACGGVRNIVGIYAWLEKYCTRNRILQVVASYQLGKKGRKGDPFGKYLKDMHEDIMRGDATARTLVDTAKVALDAGEIPDFEDQYSMPA